MNILARFMRQGVMALLAAALITATASPAVMAQVAAAGLSIEVEINASSTGDTPEKRVARTAVAKAFYDSNGMSDRFADDLKGIDLSKPVVIIDLPNKINMYQYIRNSATNLGNFFAPSRNSTPDCLGISGVNRVQVTATLPAGKGLQSTAAPIVDTWTVQGSSVQTQGGCTQVVVNNTIKTTATFVRPK